MQIEESVDDYVWDESGDDFNARIVLCSSSFTLSDVIHSALWMRMLQRKQRSTGQSAGD